LGCLLYLGLLYRAGRRGGRPQRVLIALLASLLLVRGFDWLHPREGLDRATLALASWLPLTITLFIERVLRRHHPLWFKLFSLGASAVLCIGNLFTPSHHNARLVPVLAVCAAFTVLVNGSLLLSRRRAELSAGENALADTLVLLTLICVPLVLSDFGALAAITPNRLGSIAALLLVYSMLGTALDTKSVASWLLRYLLLVSVALLPALLLTLPASPTAGHWWANILRAWPLAYAWILLTAVAVKGRELLAQGAASDFMQWLTRASLATPTGFIESLTGVPGAPSHVSLGVDELREYDFAVLQRLCGGREQVLSVAAARRVQRAGDAALTDAADQWIDLFERTEMTHGFVVSRRSPQIVLLNIPASTLPEQAEARLRVMSHLCYEIDQRDQGHP
jgi:hypothetical protein